MPENGSGFSDDLNLLVCSGPFFPRDLGSSRTAQCGRLDGREEVFAEPAVREAGAGTGPLAWSERWGFAKEF